LGVRRGRGREWLARFGRGGRAPVGLLVELTAKRAAHGLAPRGFLRERGARRLRFCGFDALDFRTCRLGACCFRSCGLGSRRGLQSRSFGSRSFDSRSFDSRSFGSRGFSPRDFEASGLCPRELHSLAFQRHRLRERRRGSLDGSRPIQLARNNDGRRH
jgi:hypothetical protein